MRISQPAVSSHIKALENQLGRRLFERQSGRPIKLSPDGESFLAELEPFLEIGRRMSAYYDGPAKHRRPVNAVIGTHLFEDFVRPKLAEFTLENPDITFNFRPSADRKQADSLIDRDEIDVAFLTVGDGQKLPGAKVLALVETGVYGLPEFREKLNDETPFILPQQHSSFEKHTLQQLARHGLRPKNITARNEHVDVAIRLACRGIGVYHAIETFVTCHDKEGVLVNLRKFDPFEVKLFVSSALPEDWRTKLQDFFVDCFQERYFRK